MCVCVYIYIYIYIHTYIHRKTGNKSDSMKMYKYEKIQEDGFTYSLNYLLTLNTSIFKTSSELMNTRNLYHLMKV